MPPSKRKPRRSKASELKADTSDVEMPDSSPTRPSAKKRKTNSGRASRKEKDSSPEPTLPFQQNQFDDEDDEEPDAEGSPNDLMDKVISHLTVSREPVTVAREHANEGADTTGKVSAFAKIAGRDWTYYVRELTINIGRPPDDRQGPARTAGASSPIQDLKDHFPVHIDLGPSKVISRHHAAITYDADLPRDEGSWNVRVNGRNGVRVNNTLLKRGMRYQIKSGAILEIAGTQMMFVLPGGKTEIDPYFVEKAEGLDNGIEFDQAASPSETEDKPSIGNELPGYQSLAPAPPNFKRASTPPALSDGRGQRGVFDSKFTTSPVYGRGMMMESTQEIDYSRDAAKDLKPPYSYAHMIAQAIFSSEDQKLTLSNIYSFIADKYAFYRHSNSGWQNSIRHNLSLNKAFQKVPRRTDEPGKGMKWQIAPEYREEYWKKQQRRTGNSSNPSSPASNKDVNPNFRGANGQNLGYDTSMVYQFPAKDAVGSSAPPKLNINMSFPPFPSNQPYGNQGPTGPSSQPAPSTSTPQRRRTNTGNALAESPLPHDYLSSAGADGRSQHPYYSLPMSAGLQAHHSPTGPTLSSSYLDTPFHPSQHSVVTPAPLRQNPKLAPPSTLVAPSKFMPESSPAGPGLFWKGFLGGTMTPGPASAIPPDMSPVKLDPDDRRRFNGLGRDIMSSSPPPMDDDGGMSGSPSKPARGRSATHTSSSAKKDGEALRLNGNPPFLPNPLSADANAKTNNASANSSMSSNIGPPPASNQNSRLSVGPPSAPGLSGVNRNNNDSKSEPQKEDEADDGEGEDGFDLARGFAPIGSFSQRSGVRS